MQLRESPALYDSPALQRWVANPVAGIVEVIDSREEAKQAEISYRLHAIQHDLDEIMSFSYESFTTAGDDTSWRVVVSDKTAPERAPVAAVKVTTNTRTSKTATCKLCGHPINKNNKYRICSTNLRCFTEYHNRKNPHLTDEAVRNMAEKMMEAARLTAGGLSPSAISSRLAIKENTVRIYANTGKRLLDSQEQVVVPIGNDYSGAVASDPGCQHEFTACRFCGQTEDEIADAENAEKARRIAELEAEIAQLRG